MNEHCSPLDTKLAAIARRSSLGGATAAQEGLGRALLTIFPAAREQLLPDDMKMLLGKIGWKDQNPAI
ncbi:MAG: hypothetical protein LKG22_06555 [Sphingobium sp.]|jgi:hypothetical protein|nr:hypothetical protein [Sphingobium sp.]